MLEQDAAEAEEELGRLHSKLKKRKCGYGVLQGQIKSYQGIIDDQKNQLKQSQNEISSKKKLLNIFEEENLKLSTRIEEILYEKETEHQGCLSEKRKKELMVELSVNTLRMKNHQLIYEKKALNAECSDLCERLEAAMNDLRAKEEEIEKLEKLCLKHEKQAALKKGKS